MRVVGLPDDAEAEVYLGEELLGTTDMHVFTFRTTPPAGGFDTEPTDAAFGLIATRFPDYLAQMQARYIPLADKVLYLTAVRALRSSEPYVFSRPQQLSVSVCKVGVFQGPGIATWATVDRSEP